MHPAGVLGSEETTRTTRTESYILYEEAIKFALSHRRDMAQSLTLR